MPAKLFFQLQNEKQKKIMNAGISEFSHYGFTNGSTNRIVKNSGISKGSLFKYFSDKEDFYFYILDIVTTEFTASLEKETASLPSELFHKVTAYSAWEFSWYIQNPEKAKLIIRAFTKNDGEIYSKVMERYGTTQQNLYYKLLENVDTSSFRWDRKRTLEILSWFLKGFNENFTDKVQLDNMDLETLRNTYVKNLEEYMEILKTGLLK